MWLLINNIYEQKESGKNCAIQGVRLIWKQNTWLAICEFLFRDFPVNQFSFKFLHSPSSFFIQFQLFALNFNFLHCLGLIDILSANPHGEIFACILFWILFDISALGIEMKNWKLVLTSSSQLQNKWFLTVDGTILGDPGTVRGGGKINGREKHSGEEKSRTRRRAWLFFARIFSRPFIFPPPLTAAGSPSIRWHENSCEVSKNVRAKRPKWLFSCQICDVLIAVLEVVAGVPCCQSFSRR